MSIHTFISISLIIISSALIAAILLQQRGAGGSSIFGGGSSSSYYTKRGFEKILFIATIVLASIFIIGSFINLMI